MNSQQDQAQGQGNRNTNTGYKHQHGNTNNHYRGRNRGRGNNGGINGDRNPGRSNYSRNYYPARGSCNSELRHSYQNPVHSDSPAVPLFNQNYPDESQDQSSISQRALYNNYDTSTTTWYDESNYYLPDQSAVAVPYLHQDQYYNYDDGSSTSNFPNDTSASYVPTSGASFPNTLFEGNEASNFDTSAAYYSNTYPYFAENQAAVGGLGLEVDPNCYASSNVPEIGEENSNLTNSATSHDNRTLNNSHSEANQAKKNRNKNNNAVNRSSRRGGYTQAQATFRTRIQQQQQSEHKLEYENQREALIDQLISSTYECMVCVANVFRREATWNCTNCYHIFHLACIKKWVNSSVVDNCWRCPGCQNVVNYFPQEYHCFCGKTKNPPASSDIPHSCMTVCGRSNSTRPDCTHSGCNILCHPGPCPVCVSMVKRECECGKTTAFVQCSSKNPILCGQICEKSLNCNVHKCKQNCHPEGCNVCEELVTVYCECGKSNKKVTCSSEWNSNQKFSCNLVCDKLLNCSIHRCPEKCCAPGRCKPCPTSTDVILSCPCGQTSIDEACALKNLPPRLSCLDAIPTCEKICKRILPCGGLEKHFCQEKCHVIETTCPPCPLVTQVMCRCGNQELEMPCSEFLSSDEFLCKKKCGKKRRCGKHKCPTLCCAELEHICPIICNRQLKCPHRCELLCHMGYCPPCINTSFEELTCECGNAVIYPPVPCGTKPPPCNEPCQRVHLCDHPSNHSCHSEPTCPPCTVLTSKWCFGMHELRKNVLCHVTKVSCGMRCNKELNCNGGHKCGKVCHDGPCKSEKEICKLPCLKLRKCGHKCGAPCHEEGKCPEIQCKLLVPVTCICGRRDEVLLCWKREIELDKVISEMNKLSLQNGTATSEDKKKELADSIEERRARWIVLDCDKECARIDRNRKMAEALQLDNPDPETRLGPPNYSEFLRKFAQKNPQFVEMVHTKLTELVMSMKKSRKTNVTYAFDSMNHDKRTVVHEYSDHFGVKSESFDEEPNRNVIVTASKDRCWLPSVSLVNVVFCKAVTTERKNVYQDLELSGLPKSQIMGPSNRRLVAAKTTSPGMVSLNGVGAWGKNN